MELNGLLMIMVDRRKRIIDIFQFVITESIFDKEDFTQNEINFVFVNCKYSNLNIVIVNIVIYNQLQYRKSIKIENFCTQLIKFLYSIAKISVLWQDAVFAMVKFLSTALK